MRKHSAIIMWVVITTAFITGCIDTRQEYTLNPDGSGMVEIKSTIQPMNMGMVSKNDNLKNTVKGILKESAGVDAWKDITFEMTDDGKISFKGTAYFKDISKLKLKINSHELPEFVFFEDEKGRMILETVNKDKASDEDVKKISPVKLSEDEITQKISIKKAEVQQQMYMMGMFLSNFKIENAFSLPGTLQEFSNFVKEKEGTILLAFDGSRIMESVNEIIKNDDWWHEKILSGSDIDDEIKHAIEGILLGEGSLCRAIVTDAQKPLFDYKSEVATAKENFPELLEKLGIRVAIPIEPVKKDEDIKDLEVADIHVVGRQKWSPSRYKFKLEGSLPSNVKAVTGGKQELAISDNCENLLSKYKSHHKIHFPKLGKQGKVEFDIELEGIENAKVLEVASGTLDCIFAWDLKETDLGIEKFKIGARGKEFGAVITSFWENLCNEKICESLKLKMDLRSSAIKSVSFYDVNGEKLVVSEGQKSSYVDSTIIEYSYNGKFPERGSIVVEVFETTKHSIPFRISNVPLVDGQSGSKLNDVQRSNGAKVETGKNECEKTLISAASYGHTETVKYLLKKGVNVNAKDKRSGETALIAAVRIGHTETVKVLLDNGADVNIKIKNSTPLIAAAMVGNAEAVKLLLDNDADVNLKNSKGETALDLALKRLKKDTDYSETIELLKSAGSKELGEINDKRAINTSSKTASKDTMIKKKAAKTYIRKTTVKSFGKDVKKEHERNKQLFVKKQIQDTDVEEREYEMGINPDKKSKGDEPETEVSASKKEGQSHIENILYDYPGYIEITKSQMFDDYVNNLPLQQFRNAKRIIESGTMEATVKLISDYEKQKDYQKEHIKMVTSIVRNWTGMNRYKRAEMIIQDWARKAEDNAVVTSLRVKETNLRTGAGDKNAYLVYYTIARDSSEQEYLFLVDTFSNSVRAIFLDPELRKAYGFY